MKRFFYLTLTAATLLLSSGCAVYTVPVDERSVSTITSDTYIVTQITTEFLKDETVSALDIGAKCYEGSVYLYGEYETGAQKDRAISIARGVNGVTDVTYFLLPKEALNDPCGTSDNLLIKAELEKQLISDSRIWSTNVDYAIVRCNVVFMGIVGTQQEADLAVRYAKEIEGVRRVRSYLKVKGQ